MMQAVSIFPIVHLFANVTKTLFSSFTPCLYKHYLLQDVMIRNFNVVTENASLSNGDVTTMTIVVITATNKIVVCISFCMLYLEKVSAVVLRWIIFHATQHISYEIQVGAKARSYYNNKHANNRVKFTT